MVQMGLPVARMTTSSEHQRGPDLTVKARVALTTTSSERLLAIDQVGKTHGELLKEEQLQEST